MNKRFLMLTAITLAALAASATTSWARGFGGGGNRGGGGFGAGSGFHTGQYGGDRGGNFGGDYGVYRGSEFGGYHGGAEGNRFNAGVYGGNRFSTDGAAGYGNINRPAAAPTRGDLDHFLGLPSDEGFHQLGGRGANIADRAADGGARGFNGDARRFSPEQRQAWASTVRNNFNHWNMYGNGWYQNHPGRYWAAAGWGVGAAWNAATWPALGGWFGDFGGYGGSGTGPIDYDYGNNIVYQNGDVYMDGQDVDTASQYYDQVAAQADTGAETDADANQQWLPLGVFALTQGNQQQSDSVVQLAVNKVGIIRGNYTDTVADTTSPIQGSVDEKTQRVAWTVGDNQTTVLESGLYNLTKPEAPVLIHFGADKTQQWLLVRLDQNQQTGAAPPQTGSAAPAPAAN